MIDRYPTKTEAEQQARQTAESLDRLINPDDVQDDADSWAEVDDEAIERECAESASIMADQRGSYGVRGLIQDRAFRIWTDSMRRIVDRDMCEHLRDEYGDETLLFEHQIWLGDLRKEDAYEICHQVFQSPDYRIPQWAYDQAREEVTEAVFDATMPKPDV